MTASRSDRRSTRRISYPCEARCYAGGERLLDAHLTDLSESGAFIQTGIRLPLGSVVLLGFKARGRRVKVEAEVIHHNPEYGLGVRFLWLERRRRKMIEQVIGAPAG